MLFCTSLIALVGAADQPQSSPRKLQIVNTKVGLDEPLPHRNNLLSSSQRQSMICELLFPSSILAVKLNRKTLVIVLEAEIYIYDISNMRLLHVIETTPNPEGTWSDKAPFWANPDSSVTQLLWHYHLLRITHTSHIHPPFRLPQLPTSLNLRKPPRHNSQGTSFSSPLVHSPSQM